jgi:PPOX class probable F420-dependent enzyme
VRGTRVSLIPDSHADLLSKKGFAHIATLQPDGAPQLSVVWFDWDGEHLLFSSKLDRRKLRNLRRDPRLSVLITDPESPYRYLEIRGRVERMDPDSQAELADVLSQKYVGRPFDVPRPDEGRMRVAVRPERARAYG